MQGLSLEQLLQNERPLYGQGSNQLENIKLGDLSKGIVLDVKTKNVPDPVLGIFTTTVNNLKDSISELTSVIRKVPKQESGQLAYDQNSGMWYMSNDPKTPDRQAINLQRQREQQDQQDREQENPNQLYNRNNIALRRNTYALSNLTPGRIFADTMGDWSDRAMNRFRNNSTVKFLTNAKNAYNAFRGNPNQVRPTNSKELTQGQLEEKKEQDQKTDTILDYLKQIAENTGLYISQTDEEKKKRSERGFFGNLLNAFGMIKGAEFLGGLLTGGGIVGMGALIKGLLANFGTAAATAIGTAAGALAKIGLTGLVITGVLGTAIDSIWTFFGDSKNWDTGMTGRIFGSILGGSGGFVSSALRGVAFAYAGFKAGALFPPWGPLIGMLLGGAFGFITGYLGGEKLTSGLNEVGEWFSDLWTSFLKKLVGESVDEITNKVETNISKVNDDNPDKPDLTNRSNELLSKSERISKIEKDIAEIEKENPGVMPPDIARRYARLRGERRALMKEIKEQGPDLNQDIDDTIEIQTQRETVRAEPGQINPETGSEVTINEKRLAQLKITETNLQKENRRLERLLENPENLLSEDERQNYLSLTEYVDAESSKMGDWFGLGDYDEIVTDGMKDYDGPARTRGEMIEESRKTIEELEEKISKAEEEAKLRMMQNNAEMMKMIADKRSAQNSIASERLLSATDPTNSLTQEVTTVPPPPSDVNELTYGANKLVEQNYAGTGAFGAAKMGLEPETVQEPVERVASVGEGYREKLLENASKPEAPVRRLNNEDILDFAGDLIKLEEMNNDPYLKAQLDPNPYWEDGSDRYQIGYGSNYMYDPDSPDAKGGWRRVVASDTLKNKREAEAQMNAALERELGYFKEAFPAQYDALQNIENPARKIVLYSTLYQLGHGEFGRWNDTWTGIKNANNSLSAEKGNAWALVGEFLKDSNWWRDDTRNRAQRVIDTIISGGAVYGQTTKVYEPSVIGASDGQTKIVNEGQRAEGGIADHPQQVIVGDYKGVKNNPEVIMPMNDLEERVLQTVTKMSLIRDHINSKNHDLQTLNYEMRMQKLVESNQQIQQRIQAKESIENSRQQVIVPPVITQVDNSQVNQTNQSIIVNRPVDNTYNPFRLSLT